MPDVETGLWVAGIIAAAALAFIASTYLVGAFLLLLTGSI